MRRQIRMHYADSERDADMLYATGFFAPDPFLFIEFRGRKMMLLSDLEFDRGEKQGHVDEVLSLTAWADKAREKFGKAGMAEIIAALILSFKTREVEVPAAFPLGLTRRLESMKLRVRVCEGEFFPGRVVKRKDEIRHIEAAQRATERAVAGGIALIAASKIRGRRLLSKGKTLTADAVRARINGSLMEQGMIPAHSIVAPGEQATDPHNEGHGPIRPGEAVVMDIFPRSEKTGYFADMTRTVVKGRPSDALLGLYAAVQAAQEAGLRAVRAGVSGAEVHGQVEKVLASRGYATGRKNGKMQGFFHGTGHGVGLQIHEEPRVSRGGQPLPANAVVTVEPGLYYPGIGGVRLEDMVVVKRGGSENLTRFPKVFRV